MGKGSSMTKCDAKQTKQTKQTKRLMKGVTRRGMILREDRPGLAKVWPSIPSAADSSTICIIDARGLGAEEASGIAPAVDCA